MHVVSWRYPVDRGKIIQLTPVNWVGLEETTGIAEGRRAKTDLAAANREGPSRYRETLGNLIKRKRLYPTKKAHPRATRMETTVTGIPTLACDQKLTEIL